MKIVRISVLCLSLAIAGSTALAQTADELAQKNLVARGGADKLRAIGTLLITGKISLGDATSPITVKARRTNQLWEHFGAEGMEVTRAYDGSVAWQKMEATGQETKMGVLAGWEADQLQEEAENAIEGPLLDYAKKGSKLQALGRGTWAGKSVYKMKVTTHLGTVITQFLDTKTYLEIHEEIERTANGKPMVIVEDVGDYRQVGGVKFAHRFVSGPPEDPKATVFQVEKMQLNVAIEPAVFVMPR